MNPQNMESELRVAALAALNPLFALRYLLHIVILQPCLSTHALRKPIVRDWLTSWKWRVWKRNRTRIKFIFVGRSEIRQENFPAKIAVPCIDEKRNGERNQVFKVKPGDSLKKKKSQPP